MPISDLSEMERHVIMHNAVGMLKMGLSAEDAIEMAFMLEEPLQSKMLRIKRPGSAGGTGSTGGPGSIGPSGPHGGITGG